MLLTSTQQELYRSNWGHNKDLMTIIEEVVELISGSQRSERKIDTQDNANRADAFNLV